MAGARLGAPRPRELRPRASEPRGGGAQRDLGNGSWGTRLIGGLLEKGAAAAIADRRRTPMVQSAFAAGSAALRVATFSLSVVSPLDRDVGREALERLLADAADQHQVLRVLELAALLAVLDDARGHGGADAGEQLQLIDAGGVDVDHALGRGEGGQGADQGGEDECGSDETDLEALHGLLSFRFAIVFALGGSRSRSPPISDSPGAARRREGFATVLPTVRVWVPVVGLAPPFSRFGGGDIKGPARLRITARICSE